MEHTLVAVFDNETRAEEALNDLLACGIQRDALHINAANQGDLSLGTATGNMQETGTQAAPHEESIGEKITAFFRNLFGGDNEATAQSNLYAEAARRGKHVLTVRVDDDRQMSQATDILNQHSPIDIEEHAAEWRSSGWSPEQDFAASGYAAGSEGLDSTQAMEQGAASSLSTEGQQRDIERERDLAARQTGNDLQSEAGQMPESERERSFDTQQANLAGARGVAVTGSIPVEDQLQFGKRVVQRGGVRVVQHITEQPETGASAQSELSLDDSEFRTHWQQSFAQAGGRYEDYAPAYRYGYSMHGSNQYRDRTWDEVEPQIRADWEAKHVGSPWERAKEAVRVGWEKMTG